MHWCANLVCLAPGQASAVLLRALEPVSGLRAMRERRGGVPDRQLCSGPGRLCQALAITREQDGRPMRRSGITVIAHEGPDPPVALATPRVGITKAADWPLRFVVEGRRDRGRPGAGRARHRAKRRWISDPSRIAR
jgi:DNA-3-methyladenine glycosylase